MLTTLFPFPVYQFIYLSFDGLWIPVRDIRMGPLVLLMRIAGRGLQSR